jgi:hypothetical protein
MNLIRCIIAPKGLDRFNPDRIQLEVLMSQPTYLACGFALCLVTFSGLVFAQSLPVSHQGPTGVSYFSGGIGTDETRAIRDDARHHSLALEFLERQGKAIVYSSGVSIRFQRSATFRVQI